MEQAFAVLQVAGESDEQPKALTRGAQWRAEMRQRTVIQVKPETSAGDSNAAELAFKIHVRAGDTEPFTVVRSMSDLLNLASATQEAYGDKLELPPLPAVNTSLIDEAVLATATTLVQGWFDDCLAALPGSADRIVFGRAIETDPKMHTSKKILQGGVSRAAANANMAAKVAMNATGTKLANIFRKEDDKKVALLNDENIELIVEHLSSMRGAALKFTQQLVSRDQGMMNPKLKEALKERILNRSVTMPQPQVVEMLNSELGADWQKQLDFFNPTPFAAASIGQVHCATVNDKPVVLKIQFPGVKEAIASDLSSISTLMNLLVKNGQADGKIFTDMYTEMYTRECEYRTEAANCIRYAECFRNDGDYEKLSVEYDLPEVVDSLSSDRVITMSLVSGTALHHMCGSHIPQDVRNALARRLVRLKFRELLVWRYMNTDPHMGNFLCNSVADTLGVLDFGSCKEVDPMSAFYLKLILKAYADQDEAVAKELIEEFMFISSTDGPKTANFLDNFVRYDAIFFKPLGSPEPVDFELWGMNEEIRTNLGGYDMEKLNGLLDDRGGQSLKSLAEQRGGTFDYDSFMLMDSFRIVFFHLRDLKAKIVVKDLIDEVLVLLKDEILERRKPCKS
eukprot:CAMPEP_0119334672 /NCGR_PEP_ID=MMETSP1333-20130426/87780_1 /TAXON_ID=418940 /ORGANISM="Scyphosphaera apsteinii, Strain RCC1455" /LENGTH=623 /DNA_ID=CAMNT_0007345021 /DNA_START=87 /DNA_END=1958 /DNA_ORIENTATION=+